VAAVTAPSATAVAGRGAGAILAALRATATGIRRHWPLALVLTAGAALRYAALQAVYPGIWFPDSNNYVREAALQTLSTVRVGGYALVVEPFWRIGSASALIVLQHVIGLGMGVVLYALLVHRGVSRPLALLAILPAALDAYLIDIEHMIMSETIFHASIVCGLAFLLWKDRPGPVAMGAAGLLLGYAAIVRSVAFPFIVVLVVYLLVRRVGWSRLAVFCACWALVTGAYAGIYDAQHGVLGFTQYGPRFLYAQVAPFADCAQLPGLPAGERSLCPGTVRTTNAALWAKRSPIHGLPIAANPRIQDFAMRVIRHDPLDFLKLVGAHLIHYLSPGHHIGSNDYPVTTWQFSLHPAHWNSPGYKGPIRPGRADRRIRTTPGPYVNRMVRKPRVNVAASRFLHDYQRIAYTSGAVLSACLLLVLAAVVLRRGASRLRLDAALLAASTLVALLVASALSIFDYRYGLLAILLLPAAAALALTALVSRPPDDEVAACR
jgi:hypothetical protein